MVYCRSQWMMVYKSYILNILIITNWDYLFIFNNITPTSSSEVKLCLIIGPTQPLLTIEIKYHH
jgi:hypothetical protein